MVITVTRDKSGHFAKGNRLQDLSGMRFGRLTAIKLSSKRSGRKTYWLCKCDCGREKTVRTDILKNGSTLSCGCLKKEQDKVNLLSGQGRVKHGYSKTRLYHIWRSMHNRCNNSKDKRFERYGSRGISICSDWDDINNFVQWALENGYADNLSIDRINVNGNYEPDNCRWANISVQANNKTNNVLINYDGQTRTISEWAKQYNLNRDLISNRYKRGILPPRLFEQKLVPSTSHLITYKNQTKSIAEWARELQIKPKTIAERAKKGIEVPDLLFKGRLNSHKNKKTPR